jgi:hypothetical protein
LLFFWDLKRSGVDVRMLRVVWIMLLGTMAVGPGAVSAGLWWWREEILAGLDEGVGKE